jgi:outer membrane receptor protein involved in Fe transport
VLKLIFFQEISILPKNEKMIKKNLLLLIFLATSLITFPQETAVLKGKVTDNKLQALAGVHIYMTQNQLGTITNAEGEYSLANLLTGKQTIEISYTGFSPQKIELNANKGLNTLNIILEETIHDLQGVVVSAQKREQQIQDVPISISAISNKTISDLNIQNLEDFSNLVPGLNIRVQSSQHPNFIIRGLTSDEVSPNAQPRVSLFFNNVPITQASGGVLEFYDMDRIEVLKGPQGTTFGRGAQIGAVHFLTKMPDNDFGGYISGGFGSYAQTDLNAAINLPILKNKLNTRIAAVYNKQDGYVKNTFGGTLNGKDTKGVRFSARYLPSAKTKIDFIFNFQQDRAPGVAFMSGMYPNTNGITEVFSYEASLDKGDELKTNKDLVNFILNFRHYFNENLFLTAITSYQTNKTFERYDGDGTAAAAIDMAGTINSNQLSQEVRLNYGIGNKFNGFSGLNYLSENTDQTYWFSPDETNMVHLFLDPSYMIMPNGQPYPLSALPMDPRLGPLGGMPLPTHHEEENFTSAENRAFELFTDGSLLISPKFKLSGGLRIVFDHSNVSNRASFTAGSESTLGMLTGNYPNLFFKPSALQSTSSNFIGFTGRLVASYKLNETSNLFVSYAKGRRPNVIQYQSDGSSEILDAEIVNSFDLGYKTVINNQFIFDATIYYYDYHHFQTNAWIADPMTGNFAYIIKDGGKATTYGLETSFQYSITEHFKLFGNYAFTHARYNKKDKDGNEQEYAGNKFRLTPDHSFNLSMKYQVPLNDEILLFAIPSLSYKSHFFFEDANTEGIEQDAYSVLNLSMGMEFLRPSLTITLFSQNLLNEEYLIGAGNTGSMFGIPTFVPSQPRTFGIKVSWNF